jgi:hypothetical protein
MARKWLLAGVAVVVLLSWSQVWAFRIEDSPYVEIWTDKGEGAVYREGDGVEVCIRPTYDCYVIVYEIDTDGYLRVLYPYDNYDDGYVVGGRTYRIGRDGHRRFYVAGLRGVEYVHVVASFEPFRQLYWHGCQGYENYVRDVTWRGFSDYWGCALPPRVYGDPYIAMQSIDEFICYGGLEAGLVWADFTYFYVHERVSYPRYLCYDCHGNTSYIRPYVSVCPGFSITFVDCGPHWRPWSWWWWCTPTRVYCGPRYVCYSKKPCKGYPSQYKWKSRGQAVCDAQYAGRQAVRLKSGHAVDGVRVKSKQKTRDRDLYARRERRGTTKYKRTPTENTRQVEVKRAIAEPTRVKSRDRRAEPEPTRQTRIKKTKHTRTEPARSDVKSVKARKARTPKKESTLTKIVRTIKKSTERSRKPKAAKVTRESKKSKESKAAKVTRQTSKSSKKVAPKVRTKNQGRSPATRRRVSR